MNERGKEDAHGCPRLTCAPSWLTSPRDSSGMSRPWVDGHLVVVAYGGVLQEARANVDSLGHAPFGVRSWFGDLNFDGSFRAGTQDRDCRSAKERDAGGAGGEVDGESSWTVGLTPSLVLRSSVADCPPGTSPQWPTPCSVAGGHVASRGISAHAFHLLGPPAPSAPGSASLGPPPPAAQPS